MRRERCPSSVPCPRCCEDENERTGLSFGVNERARDACELVDYRRPQRSSTPRRSMQCKDEMAARRNIPGSHDFLDIEV